MPPKKAPKPAPKPVPTERQLAKMFEAGIDPFADSQETDEPVSKQAPMTKKSASKKGRKPSPAKKSTASKKGGKESANAVTEDVDDDEDSMAMEDENSDLQSVESVESKPSSATAKRSYKQISSVLETHSKPSPPKGKVAKTSKSTAKNVTAAKAPDAHYINPNAMWAAPTTTSTASLPRVHSGASISAPSNLGSASSINNIPLMAAPAIKKKKKNRDAGKPYVPPFHDDLAGYMSRVGDGALSVNTEDLAAVHESLGEAMDSNVYVTWTSFQPAREMQSSSKGLSPDGKSASHSNEERSFTDHYGVRCPGFMEEYLGDKSLLDVNDNYDINLQEMYKAIKIDMYRNASEDYLSTLTIPPGHDKSACGVMEGIDYSAPARQLQHLLNTKNMIQADNVNGEQGYGPTSATWWGIRSDGNLPSVLQGRIAHLRQEVTAATRERQKKVADKRRDEKVADLQRQQEALAAEMLAASTSVDIVKQRQKADALKSRGQAAGLVSTSNTTGTSSSAGYSNVSRHNNRDSYSNRNDSAGYNNSNGNNGNRNGGNCNGSGNDRSNGSSGDRDNHNRNHGSGNKKKKNNKHRNNDNSNSSSHGNSHSRNNNNRNDNSNRYPSSSRASQGNKYGPY